MAFVHSIFFALHILVGAAALVLFWIPIFSKKGQLNHVVFGRYYKTVMYAVAGTGAIMALMVLSMPLAIKGHHISESANLERALFNIRLFWGFLLYLSLLSFVSTRHGIKVLTEKTNHSNMRTFEYQSPVWLLLIGGVICFVAGIVNERTLHIIFGILGFFLAQGILRYTFKKEVQPGQWVLEHLGTMIGSGIGAYTAFLAFGGRTLFSELGQWQIAFWIAPGVIGTIAANIVAKKYARKLRLHH
jgi:hypothetical protein